MQQKEWNLRKRQPRLLALPGLRCSASKICTRGKSAPLWTVSTLATYTMFAACLRTRGLTERLKNAFLVYLMGHNRPMAELLAPQAQDIESLYRNELMGMVDTPANLDQLQNTLQRLVTAIHAAMTDSDKHFLLALKQGTQDWRNFFFPEAERLPAIQWKMVDLARMQPAKRRQATKKLKTILFG